jgi:cytosine/adenosine deaminase-related metal-dependent hydrolase
VLRGARWPGDVVIAGGRIAVVGSVPAEPGDEVVRVDGDIVTAGLVNTHHHFYQWLTRGWAFDCTLFRRHRLGRPHHRHPGPLARGRLRGPRR